MELEENLLGPVKCLDPQKDRTGVLAHAFGLSKKRKTKNNKTLRWNPTRFLKTLGSNKPNFNALKTFKLKLKFPKQKEKAARLELVESSTSSPGRYPKRFILSSFRVGEFGTAFLLQNPGLPLELTLSAG